MLEKQGDRMDAIGNKSAQQPGGPLVGGSATLRQWTVASVAIHVCVLGALLYVRSPQLSACGSARGCDRPSGVADVCARDERTRGKAAVGEGAAAETRSHHKRARASANAT